MLSRVNDALLRTSTQLKLVLLGHVTLTLLQDKGTHPTRRIELTTGRDKTVTVLCLPPPDPCGGVVRHAYVVGSATALAGGA